ncbi:carbohydrate kinase family protein [Motiliproteus sp. MSK22-1]|uniref:carbohydrate kinase family protein n=1 Tax=Motiliproteus sp. MSK22-1 TaxID=1897630 RepID=UPI0009763784|nr:carbohydrate kinase family protein [Motiliproteus sp. MSK22-1]OMH29102.1 kinase [Motiliproteus sp. MSK22-1]
MNRAKQKKVLIVGGTSYDRIIHLEEFLQPTPQTVWAQKSYCALGGTGAGKALNLAQLDFDVTVHTILGHDREAAEILSCLDSANVRCLVTRTEQGSEQHTNLMSVKGERISIFTNPPANPDHLDWTRVEEALVECDIAAISILDYTRPALAKAREMGKPLWIDLHDYDGANQYHQDFIEAADVVFVSSDCLPNYREFMCEQIASGKDLVVCTHGKAGSEALDSQCNWYQQDIADGFELLDSNGAGDAFFSGFLYSYLNNRGIQVCLRYGSLAAAMCINTEQLASNRLSPRVLELHYSQRY